MRARWLELRDESLLRRAALLPLGLPAWAYATGAALHRAAYARGWRQRRRLPCPVIAVGSALVGGTGKTPLAAWLASALRRRGFAPALISRGYGRTSREPVTLVSDGRRVLADLEAAGDEALLLAALAKGVPVLVARDRARAGLRAIAGLGCDVIILDDGLQHHRLERDVQIATFSGSFGLGNGRVLPRGPLRERATSLRGVDSIAVVDGPLPERDARSLESLAPGAWRIRVRRRPVALRPTGARTARSVSSLADAEVGLIAALARPASLRESVEALGGRVVAERYYRDHHRFTPQDLRGLRDQAPRWITTSKDAVKLRAGWARGVELEVLESDLLIDDASGLLAWVEARIGAQGAGADQLPAARAG